MTFTLATDLIGAWASFLLGQYVFPAYLIALRDVLAFLGGILTYVVGFFASLGGSLQGGDPFLLFMGPGAFLGLLFGVIVATRDRYGNVEVTQGFFTFVATVVVAFLSWFVYGLVTHWKPVQGAFVYPHTQLTPNQLSAWICLAGYVLTHLICALAHSASSAEHLSRADPKGPLQEQLNRCYARFNTALMRFQPRRLRDSVSYGLISHL